MLPDGRRLGAHLPLATGMLKAVARARDIGANALQIFTDNPTAWKRRAEPPPELDAFRERTRELDIRPISVHASYLVNLAGSNPESYERSIAMLAHELRQAPTFGARYVNVHIGSHLGLGVAAGIERLGEGILRTLAAADAESSAAPAMLILENSAGSGGGLGTNVKELASIAAKLAALGIPDERVGFCIDTAHAWGAGIDVAKPPAFDAFIAAFDDRIGLGRLVLIHLNDSRSDRGSRTDRHEHLGAGKIGPEGLAHVLRHPGLAHVTYLLETPGMDVGYDAINLARARDLVAGRTLRRLPRAAFELRGSSTTRTAPA